MKNRKLILITLTAILLASIFVISVAAAGAVATTDGKTCAKGSTVTLNVCVNDVADVFSGAVAVEYDPNVLELVEAEWNTSDVLSAALLKYYDYEKDLGAFSFAAETDISGKIFSVTFRVLDDAPLGKSTVSCTVQLKTNTDTISVTNNPGYVEVICNHNYNEKNNQHLASGATCTAPAKYYYTCSHCGAVGSTTYSHGDPLPHTFDQQKTTTDYLVEEVKCVSEAEYYYSCSCGAKGSEKFTADASWSHNYSGNWYVDTTSHWHQCADCGQKKDVAEHTPGEDNVCTCCNFTVTTQPEHQHAYDGEFHSDENGHWQECSCGLKSEVQAHNWSEGKCTVCEAEDPDYNPNPPAEDPENPDKEPEKDPEDDKEASSGIIGTILSFFNYLLDHLAILILLLICIIMIIALFVIFVQDMRY